MRHLYTCLLIITLFALSSCGNRQDLVIQYVDPLEKILPEQALFMPSTALADVARGEQATFQFAVRCNQPIKGLRVLLKPFVDDTSQQKHFFEGVKISFVGNVHEGRTQADPGKDFIVSPSNFYPDPLLDEQTLNIGANISSAIWISIPIPTNATPGIYKSEVVITGRINEFAFKRTLPIEIHIYSTVIDHQTLMVSNWYQDTFKYLDEVDPTEFSPRWWELMGQLADLMHDYRQNVVMISPLKLAQYTFDEAGEVTAINFERFDSLVDFFAKKGVLERIEGGHIAQRLDDWKSQFGYTIPKLDKGNTSFVSVDCNNAQAQRFYRTFFASLGKHLHEKGWASIYMQHVADEPVAENASSYTTIASFVRQQLPDCKIIDACHTKDLQGQIDVWVPQLNNLQQDYSFYQDQQRQGKEVWFYTCVQPQGNYANRYIRQPLVKTRLLHWINYKYNINGYLHWGMNFWRGEAPMVETTSIQTNGVVLPAGDAWIVYPYKKHLIPSIRLEAMRDGIADYELLRMLEQKDSTMAKQIVDNVIYNFQQYDTDIAHFRFVRKSLLEALEPAPSSPTAPVTTPK